MKKIYFNDDLGVHTARYKIVTRSRSEGYGNELVIFITQKDGDGCSLMNSDIARNQLINKILKRELSGLELQYIRLYYQWQTHENRDRYRHCWEFYLDFDYNEIPHEKKPSFFIFRFWYWLRKKETTIFWFSRNVLAGKVRVYSDFKISNLVPEDKVKALLKECEDTDPSAPPSLSPGLRAMLRHLQPPSSNSLFQDKS